MNFHFTLLLDPMSEWMHGFLNRIAQNFTEEDIGFSFSVNKRGHHQNAKGYEKIVSHWLLYTTRIHSLHK